MKIGTKMKASEAQKRADRAHADAEHQIFNEFEHNRPFLVLFARIPKGSARADENGRIHLKKSGAKRDGFFGAGNDKTPEGIIQRGFCLMD